MTQKETQETQIFELMKESAIEAGKILLSYWGKVKNKGKEADIGGKYEADGKAKTVVDEIIQELFLSSLYRICPGIQVNVEEKEGTPLRYLFAGNSSELTIHQDPCDGSRSYLEGHSDEFTTGYGISDKDNEFTHTVIIAPARDRMYIASPKKWEILDSNGCPVEAEVEENPKKIFEKRLLSKKGRDKLRNKGFCIKGIRCSHTAIIDVALGKAAAFLYGLSNPHDSFIPYAFAMKRGATLRNAKGKPLSGIDISVSRSKGFLEFRRLASVCYFSRNGQNIKEIVDTLASIVSKPEYLDDEYCKQLKEWGLPYGS